jgi:hypothetical protein
MRKGIFLKNRPRSHILRFTALPQTRWLLTSLGLGYGCLLVVFKFRLIVWLLGAVVTVSAIAFWCRQLPAPKTPSRLSTLLDQAIFLEHLSPLSLQVPASSRSVWDSAYQHVFSAQQSAMDIGQKEPTLLPDLLETLHSLLDLAVQLVSALQAFDKMHTPDARNAAAQQIEVRSYRLKESCKQLHQLQDQLALNALHENRSATALPIRLQSLIADNKSVLS